MRRSLLSWGLGWTCALLLLSQPATAHDGSHERMPNQVAVGLVPLHITSYRGRHAGLSSGPVDELSFDELSALALGVTLSYGYTLANLLELRLRSEYIKPFPSRDVLADGLHEFRGVLGVSGVVPLYGDQVQLALGPEAGMAAWRLTELDVNAADASAHALGYTLSFSASLRGWVTYHTGFWLELNFGVADTLSPGELDLSSRWPMRVALGWADRF